MSHRAEAPTLTRVTRFGLVNAYLVDEGEALTLVDTGMAKSERHILAAASAVGKPIARILLTHAHGDHVGSVDALVAELPEVEVLISERDAKVLAGDRSFEAGEPATKMKGQFIDVATVPGTFVPGDRIGSLASAKALRALEPSRLAPGHGRVVADPLAAMDRAIAKGA